MECQNRKSKRLQLYVKLLKDEDFLFHKEGPSVT